MAKDIPYIDRDISWLAFNYRVLQEAKDKNVPLMERLKFLAIYSSNLDEFFKVRVANHKNLILAGKKTFKQVEFSPKQILREILSIVNKQQKEFSRIFQKEIIPELKSEGIRLLRAHQLDEEQLIFIENFFNDDILPYIQPVLLREDKIKPFLMDGDLYLSIYMKSKEKQDKEKYYAIVKIPSEKLGRFIVLPEAKKGVHDLIMIDDIIRFQIHDIFPGFDIQDTFSIKLTRDAELYIDDEYSGDLIEKIKRNLARRKVGTASRLIYDREMPGHMLEYLMVVFDLSTLDLLEEGRYHSNSDFMNFPRFKKNHLKNENLEPIPYNPIELSDNLFKTLDNEDHLLYYPYHSYNSVIKFFKKASTDPRVTHIKVFQYRVAKSSKIMNALIKAAENGKQVMVFIEVKARFDEENNLDWGEKLEASGVKVLYSIPGVKVHSKVALIRRVIDGQESFYAYMSTGNFNEKTATLYTDFGYFTTKPTILKELLRIFTFIETRIRPDKKFKLLGVGTFNLKEKFKVLIRREIDLAKEGKPAYIKLKMNSLQDSEMIELLYEASQAGVQIQMVVRGIFSLVAGLDKVSENIKAVSILDRFLEHARIYIFGNNGDELIYVSSADWMVRNLHHRIETAFPILDEKHKEFINTIMRIQLNDNIKARNLAFDKMNKYKKTGDSHVRSQYDTYYYIKRREENRNL